MKVNIANDVNGSAWLTLTATTDEVSAIDAHYEHMGFYLREGAHAFVEMLSLLGSERLMWLAPDGSGITAQSCSAVRDIIEPLLNSRVSINLTDTVTQSPLASARTSVTFNLAMLRVKLQPNVPTRMRIDYEPITPRDAAVVFTAIAAAYRVVHQQFASRTVEVKVTLTPIAEATAETTTTPPPTLAEVAASGIDAIFG